MEISIMKLEGGADTGRQGETVYAVISAALKDRGTVVVDFSGVQTATSSFVNSAFVQLLALYPFDEIKRRVRVVRSTRQINEMIKVRLEREASRPSAA
jgi:STAS-like domain of unknown function (DUF4325)